MRDDVGWSTHDTARDLGEAILEPEVGSHRRADHGVGYDRKLRRGGTDLIQPIAIEWHVG